MKVLIGHDRVDNIRNNIPQPKRVEFADGKAAFEKPPQVEVAIQGFGFPVGTVANVNLITTKTDVAGFEYQAQGSGPGDNVTDVEVFWIAIGD